MIFQLPDLRLILRAVAALALLAVFALAPVSVSLSGVAHAQSADPEPTIVNICDRTPQVRDAILANLRDVSDCAAVTDSDLNRVRRLPLYYEEITALQAGDFQGLANLERLYLDGNSLTELPDGVFNGLSNLEWLDLYGNSLTELPDGVFDGLSNLEYLYLDGNSLSELPDGVFNGLSNLEWLYLGSNDLTTLPDGVFGGLSNLEYLYLDGNSLSELPDGVFGGLSSLGTLDLRENDLTGLPDGVFDSLDSLEFLYLQSNDLTGLPDGVFDELTNLESLEFSYNDLTQLRADVFNGLSKLESLEFSYNDLTALPADVFDGLSSLENLDLKLNDLSKLPAGVFDGLSSLEDLLLGGNYLTALPAGVFNGLSNLEYLSLSANDLTALPAGVFNGLSNLEDLKLHTNDLSALPAGVFDGLSSLRSVDLQDNPGAPFTLTVELEQRGDDALVIKVPEGTPSDMTVILVAQGGALSSTTYTIHGGSVTSEEISVTPDDTGQVTIGIESVAFKRSRSYKGIQTGLGKPLVLGGAEAVNTPAMGAPTISGTAQVGETLTASISGIADADGLTGVTYSYQWLSSRDTEIQGATGASYTLVPADRDKTIKVRVTFTDDGGTEETLTSAPTAAVIAVTPTSGGICDRTPQVRAATLAKLPGVSDCSVVTDVDLGGIKQEIDLTGQNISELKAADFQGLTRLQSLRLNNNDLTILPDNVFDGLTSLEWLKLKNNDLSELPDNVFDDLASLRSLSLDDNDLGELPDNVFDGLANLSSLSLDGNDLGELPNNVFDGLANLSSLSLDGNDLGELPDNVFDDLTRLEGLYLRDNDLEEMPSRVFDDLSSLEFLALQDNSLSELPPGVFDGLAKLQELSLTRNDLGELPDNVFDDLAEVATLSLDGNDLKELPPGVFDGLSNLEWLQLGSNDLSELPDGVFDGLSKLEDLYLYDNDLRELPAGVFDGLSKLERLQLGSNDLSELPAGVLDGLSKLEYLYLYDNDLRELPAGMFEGIHGLKGLYLTKNPGSTFVLTAELERRGDDEFVVKVAQGAPFKITVTLSAQGGTLSPTYVEILGGRTTSGPIFIRSVEPEASQVTISVDSTAFTDYLGIGVGLPSVHGIQTGPGAPLVIGEAEPVNTPATGAPTISGTTQVGETLTASTSGIADADGLSGAIFSYQWLSSRDTEIQGATDVSYTIVAADEGKTIKVRVTFTDDTGHEETLTSAPTAAVPPASGPAVAIGLSPSGSVAEGTETTVTMSFGGLERDSDPNDVDYIFRADVVSRADGNSADICEGKGIGSNRNFNQVDEDPEVRTGTVSASCTPGDYTVEVSVSSPSNIELASATADFTVNAPGQQQPEPSSTDATLSNLALSGVYFGTFYPATTGYHASVANDVTQTTVTPTVNHDGATYAIKLGGVTDADGVIPLAVGSNVITVEITAEDGNTAKTYTVTVTRAAPPPSTDATLNGLALSGVYFGTFYPATTGYNASVANDVDETTVTPTTNDAGATYAIKLGGVTDADRVIPLAVGSNVITVEVTAEDGNTAKTYTVTVTRAEPTGSGPAVTVELSPSGSVEPGTAITATMTFGGLETDSDTSTTDYTFRADVVNADACEGGGMGNDRYMYKVDEDPEVRTGSIATSCAPGDYTVEVSISSPGNVELASATAGFTVNAPAQQQPPPEPPSTDATLSGLTLSDVTLAFASATTEYTASVANDVTETTVTPTLSDDGASYAVKLDGVADADRVIPLAMGSNVITIEVTAEDGNTAKTYTVTVTRAAPPLSTDATLSGLTLSDAPFTFASDTTSYDVNVANGVDRTTVTATANDDGASYAVKLDGAVDEDETVELSVGSNVITVEVTAEDGKTTKTYTVTVTRADPPPPEPVEPEPESTGERSAWLEQNPENKPFVGEWQHFTLRGSGLDKVNLSVNVIGFGGAPSSTGAVGYATASPLPAVGEVCGDAYYSGYQMSVDRTFSMVGCREGTVVIELLDPGNGYALLKRYTVTVDAGP